MESDCIESGDFLFRTDFLIQEDSPFQATGYLISHAFSATILREHIEKKYEAAG